MQGRRAGGACRRRAQVGKRRGVELDAQALAQGTLQHRAQRRSERVAAHLVQVGVAAPVGNAQQHAPG